MKNDGIDTVIIVYMAILKLLDIFTLISIAIANNIFEIIDIIKYLLILNLLLSNASIKLPKMIISAPIILVSTKSSFRNINPNIIKNTVDNCFNMLKVEGSRPYLASIFSLSVAA